MALLTGWDSVNRCSNFIIQCDTCSDNNINAISAQTADECIDKAIKKFWKRQAGKKSSDPMRWVCLECQKKANQIILEKKG